MVRDASLILTDLGLTLCSGPYQRVQRSAGVKSSLPCILGSRCSAQAAERGATTWKVSLPLHGQSRNKALSNASLPKLLTGVVLTHCSNAAGTKRHFESPEDATPPEAQAPAYQNSGAQYGYGAPAVKRQRSDNEYNNPYAYAPHYQDNTPRYYSATPDARSYGAQAQAYPQTQTMLGVGAMPVQASFQNAHGQYHLQSTVQTSQTPAASSATTGNWTGAFPHAPLSAPAGSSGQPAYGRNTLSTRPTYYNDWQQHQQPDVPYGAQTHAAPYYHTPNSMTADTPQNAAYLPSNVGHGADVDHANMADSSLGEQNVLQGGPDSMWTPSSHSSLPTLPALSSLATSSGAYYQQPYPETSKYPDPTIAATSMSDPYQYTTISTSASPLLTYSGPALQNATLNSAYTAEAYQGQ